MDIIWIWYEYDMDMIWKWYYVSIVLYIIILWYNDSYTVAGRISGRMPAGFPMDFQMDFPRDFQYIFNELGNFFIFSGETIKKQNKIARILNSTLSGGGEFY